MITIPDTSNDIDREFARRAFYNVSFSPERRGDQEIADYQATVQSMAQAVKRLAKGEREQEAAQEVFDYLRERLLKLTKDYLGAKSRCLSSMITGPANFPVRRS